MNSLNDLVKSAGELANALTHPDDYDRLSLEKQFDELHSTIKTLATAILKEVNKDSFFRYTRLNNQLTELKETLQSAEVRNFSEEINAVATLELDISKISKIEADVIYTNRLKEIHAKLEKINSSPDDPEKLLKEIEDLLKMFNENEPKRDRSIIDYADTNELRNKIIVQFRDVATKLLQNKIVVSTEPLMTNSFAASSSESLPEIAMEVEETDGEKIIESKPEALSESLESYPPSPSFTDFSYERLVDLFVKYSPILEQYKTDIAAMYNTLATDSRAVWFPVDNLTLISDKNGESTLVPHIYKEDFSRGINKMNLLIAVGDQILEIDIKNENLTAVGLAKKIEDFLVKNGLKPTDALQAIFLLCQDSHIDQGAINGVLKGDTAEGGPLQEILMNQPDMKSIVHEIHFIPGDGPENSNISVRGRSEIALRDNSIRAPNQFATIKTDFTLMLQEGANNTYTISTNGTYFDYQLEFTPEFAPEQ